MTTALRHRDIKHICPPRILFYGNSCVGRLCWWKEGTYGSSGPDELENIVLSESKFTYSGGAKWSDVHRRVNGLDLPMHQTQGDTWSPIVEAGFDPLYVFMVVGSNTVDSLNDSFLIELRKSTVWHLLIDPVLQTSVGPSKFLIKKNPCICDVTLPPKKEPVIFNIKKFLDDKFEKVKGQIDHDMLQVKTQYPDAEYHALSILLRDNWFPPLVLMAYRLNAYLSVKHSVKLSQMNGFVAPYHMCSDNIHFNSEGYSLFISKGIGPLLDEYHEMNRKPRNERRPPVLSKSAKRHRRNAAKKATQY